MTMVSDQTLIIGNQVFMGLRILVKINVCGILVAKTDWQLVNISPMGPNEVYKNRQCMCTAWINASNFFAIQ